MKRTPYIPHILEFFVKAGLIAALAAVLLAPMTIKTTGNELARRAEHASPMLKPASWKSLALPPIPHLQRMPWLTKERGDKWMRIDTLLPPKFEIPSPPFGEERASRVAGLPSALSEASYRE